MRETRWLLTVVLAVAGMLAMQSMAQAPVITSFQGNGQLSWTNAVNSNALYRVEWASQADGPWYQTFQAFQTIDAHSNTFFSVRVPMFYRVVMTTNQPPLGMVLIDSGDVVIGQANSFWAPAAAPVHTNFISAFWMDDTEVTKAKWDEVYVWATNHGYGFDNAGAGKTNNHPVHSVNWYDCVKWCNARSEKEGLTPSCYTDAQLTAVYRTGQVDVANEWVKWKGGGYRLPSEAEWEKAARGGREGRLFPTASDTMSQSQANYYSTFESEDVSPTHNNYHPTYNDGAYPFTSPVASFPANGYGLHDMAGNVREWCWDRFGSYSTAYQIDPHGQISGGFGCRVLRGGAYNDQTHWTQCSFRMYVGTPTEVYNFQGFRCVR